MYNAIPALLILHKSFSIHHYIKLDTAAYTYMIYVSKIFQNIFNGKEIPLVSKMMSKITPNMEKCFQYQIPNIISRIKLVENPS